MQAMCNVLPSFPGTVMVPEQGDRAPLTTRVHAFEKSGEPILSTRGSGVVLKQTPAVSSRVTWATHRKRFHYFLVLGNPKNYWRVFIPYIVIVYIDI